MGDNLPSHWQETEVHVDYKIQSVYCSFQHSEVSAYSGIVVMYCGYLVRDDCLFQRGVDMGHPRPVIVEDRMDIICLASSDLRIKTGVYPYTSFRRVKTAKGNPFWCIAFASNHPHEGLPTSAPAEEEYKALKEVLQKKGPPGWYQAS
ncbi:hypothetical protein DEU56DRAFT_758193 [Suillus clintonianus]|uniref:uncharacterized protein n=1 Tax=Suillus clintonianus TaxID=1904413 RepID=UPI001B874034|nr:uncharacterized protein DEU56DRAFT_758193 [Suillus clintonianus]KAG2129092.1 hypothetical protein DEU56DRAFT_758193 [Suillus clintonianus]